MKAYDWAGLRSRRILFALSLLAFLPVSCFASSAASAFRFPGIIGFGIGLLMMAGALHALRTWPCPRCGSNFLAKGSWPRVSPWKPDCSQCGLPEFTPSEEEAPPIGVRADSASADGPPAQDEALKRGGKKRTRIALLFAVPLVYLSMCRLPGGEPVKTPSGREIQVIGLMRSKRWTSGHGTTASVDISYYSSSPGDTTELTDVLSVVIPMIAPSDSIIRVSQVKNNWWLRTLGIRVSRNYSFSRRSDGTWNED